MNWKEKINCLIHIYEQSEKFKMISLYQYLASQGCYLTNEELGVYRKNTKMGIKIQFQWEIRKYIETCDKALKKLNSHNVTTIENLLCLEKETFSQKEN